MAQLRSNDWLRTRIFPTPFESEVLLDKMRFGSAMSETERQAVWLLLSDTVYCRSKRHYKQAQPSGNQTPGRVRNWHEMPPESSFYANRNYTTHTQRMLLLAEFLKSRLDKSSAWCIVSWKRRFMQFEELMFLRTLGVAIPVSKVQSKEIRAAVYFRRVIRESNVSYVGIYGEVQRRWEAEELAKGRPVTEKRKENFRKRWQDYDTLMSMSKYVRSFDELSDTNQV